MKMTDFQKHAIPITTKVTVPAVPKQLSLEAYIKYLNDSISAGMQPDVAFAKMGPSALTKAVQAGTITEDQKQNIMKERNRLHAGTVALWKKMKKTPSPLQEEILFLINKLRVIFAMPILKDDGEQDVQNSAAFWQKAMNQ